MEEPPKRRTASLSCEKAQRTS